MLSFALNEFLKQKLPLRDFPHQLVGCSSTEEFVKRFESLVLPLYLWRTPKADTLNDLRATLKAHRSCDLVERNFVQIHAYYLPHLSYKETGAQSSTNYTIDKRAADLSDVVLTKLGEELYHHLLVNKFPEILSEIYKQVYDPDALRREFGEMSVPALEHRPNPPYATVAKLSKLLDYFSGKFLGGGQVPLFEQLKEFNELYCSVISRNHCLLTSSTWRCHTVFRRSPSSSAVSFVQMWTGWTSRYVPCTVSPSLSTKLLLSRSTWGSSCPFSSGSSRRRCSRSSEREIVKS